MDKIVLFVLMAAIASDCTRILVSVPFSVKSHQNSFVPLAKELAHRGHHITFISNLPALELNEEVNVRQIILEKIVIEHFTMDQFEMIFGNVSKWEVAKKTWDFWQIFSLNITEVVYSHPEIQQMIQDDHFDLILMSPFASLVTQPLVWHFQAPFILISPNTLLPGIAPQLGDSDYAHFIPYPYGAIYTDQMTLFQRLANIATVKLTTTMFYMDEPVITKIAQRFIPDFPPLREIVKNVSLLFTNTMPVLNYRRPQLPQIIEVGCSHCRASQPLPPDLEDFVSSGDDGFIVFALGSLLNSNLIPKHVIMSFVQTFGKLPQRIVWQWKGAPRDDLPSNIKTMKWIPQQDLLAHPNCRLFLTHGGISGLQEAVYHGVPVLGMPVGSDQTLNLKKAIHEGYAEMLDWKDITEGNLTRTVHLILDDPKYLENVRRLSLIVRDQLETPLERAVYWTEYVLRHKGADHLRLASRNLTWYQRSLVDVYALLITVLAAPLLLAIFCLRERRNSIKPPGEATKKNQ